MTKKSKAQEQGSSLLILRYHRLMEAFSKSDDENDYFFERHDGYLVYLDLEKNDEQIGKVQKILDQEKDTFLPIPKLTYYETKKIMEGFVQEKVYDIDVKEKLLDIIQTKEAKENFLEYVYDQHLELEKWLQYFQERMRISVIDWLRQNEIHFVFEEDLEDFSKDILSKFKQTRKDSSVSKEIETLRKMLEAKAKTYYSNEALNPRPKRGRPPKQTTKIEIYHQFSPDYFPNVPTDVRTFLYIPEFSVPSHITFSSKFDHENVGQQDKLTVSKLEALSEKLASLRTLSDRIKPQEPLQTKPVKAKSPPKPAAVKEAPAASSPRKRGRPRKETPDKSSTTSSGKKKKIRLKRVKRTKP